MFTAPILPFHNTAHTATLNGYTIPQNTVLFINTYSVHMDKRHWDQPREFRPERFLNEEGKVTRPDSFLAFGMGENS